MGRRFCSSLVVLLAAVGIWAPAPVGARSDVEVITYSVKGKGNISSLEAFAARAARTYADPRGWSLGGSLRFERVASGGDFTLWLTADAQMSTFGGACDVIWSCRNGRNVVINEDRWLGASDAFLDGGGTLDRYRDMVVNHETGHWLGFDHATCSGPGRPAAVMQQQSMALNGCTFNSWPLPSERAVAAARRGVSVVPGPTDGTGPAPTTTTTAPTATSTTSKPAVTTTTTTTGRPTTPTTARPAAGNSSVPLENRCLARLGAAALRPWRRCF